MALALPLVDPARRDNRPFYALALALALVTVALLVPTSRAWLASNVGASLQGQAEPASGAHVGYSPATLAFWAVLGAAFGWASYELLFLRLALRPDARFFAALASFLLLGPLFHALLAVGAFPAGSVLAYAAAEPLIYLTTGALALAALLAARATTWWIAPALGIILLSPLLVLAALHTEGASMVRVLILVAMAVAPALLIAFAYTRWKRELPFVGVALVVGAHALDGATTWMVLRDPFGLGFKTFGEKNPVSQLLVDLSDGWPYFAIKLVLPVVLLSLIKVEEDERDLHAFILLAVFVLGFGPGMANLLQVMFA